MPDHIHLVIYPLNEEYKMEDILKSIKLGTTKSVNRRGLAEGSIWLAGGGYDRNIFTVHERIEKIRYTHLNPVEAELVEDPVIIVGRQPIGMKAVPKVIWNVIFETNFLKSNQCTGKLRPSFASRYQWHPFHYTSPANLVNSALDARSACRRYPGDHRRSHSA